MMQRLFCLCLNNTCTFLLVANLYVFRDEREILNNNDLLLPNYKVRLNFQYNILVQKCNVYSQ